MRAMVDSIRAPGDSAVPLVDPDTVHESRGWFIGLGVALLVLGTLSIFLPPVASLATTLVIGWLLVIGGLVQGYHALRNPRWAGRGWAIVAAFVYLIAGALVIAFPVAGTAILTLILASFFAASGVLKIVRAVQHRRMLAWGWLLFDGLLSLALGALIWIGWPSTAVWALGLLVGIDLVFGGSSMLAIGVGAGQLVEAR
jgi:uncharacterized membrane protein HdeD (DUF308 family)